MRTATVRRKLTLDGSFDDLSAYLSEHAIDAAVFGRDAIGFAIRLDDNDELEDVQVTVVGISRGSVVVDYVLEAPDATLLETASHRIDQRIADGEVFVFAELRFAVTGNALVDADADTDTDERVISTSAPSYAVRTASPSMSEIINVSSSVVKVQPRSDSGSDSDSDGDGVVMTALALLIAIGLWLNVCFVAVWCCWRWRKSRELKVSREFTVSRVKLSKDRCRSTESGSSVSQSQYKEQVAMDEQLDDDDDDDDDETSLEEAGAGQHCENIQLL